MSSRQCLGCRTHLPDAGPVHFQPSPALNNSMFPHRPNHALFEVLLEAYRPCRHIGTCREATWDPKAGHIPRGFLGATADRTDVEVVMVFAEPGHPHHDETYAPDEPSAGLLESGLRHVYDCYKNGTDLFHRNVRWFLSRVYPNLSFDEQLRHAWLTEGRLCSIANETGGTRDALCAQHYLARQLEMLPNATVVGFGGKAQHYLKRLGAGHVAAYALAPPGANHKPARPSWERAISCIEKRRRTPR